MQLNKLLHEIDDIRDTFESYKEEPKLSGRLKDELASVNNKLFEIRKKIQKELDKIQQA